MQGGKELSYQRPAFLYPFREIAEEMISEPGCYR